MPRVTAAVTFNRLSREKEVLTTSMVPKFIPNDRDKARAIEIFKRYGLLVTSQSDFTLSVEGEKEGYEHLFGTELIERKLRYANRASEPSVWYPPRGAKWNNEHELKDIIDDAYIQWPHYYTHPGPLQLPRLNYHHLKLPSEISSVLNTEKVHRQGITGAGVKVAILDSGFDFNHPYFVGRLQRTPQRVLGPGASNLMMDEHGHGTAMAANLLAVAPDIDLLGIKLANHEVKDASAKLNQAFEVALSHRPDIISLSLTYDLTWAAGRVHRKKLPRSNLALQGLILEAIRNGITVVCACGNGDVGFPGMMEEVISVGGVFVDKDHHKEASDFTSAFVSKIYPQRKVPDICGLSGHYNNGDANHTRPVPGGLMLVPVPFNSELDRDTRDDFVGDNGWSVIGGSSAATAQVAGICALLLQQDRSLTPSDVKRMLLNSAINIAEGKANAKSNEGRVIHATAAQPDLAVGYGLVNAFKALELMRRS